MKILFLLSCLFSNICFAQKDYSKLVNPFIGTGGHGHTYPGATSPFGFVQLSPDTRMADWDGSSGYHYSDSIIYGFSHTHLSGTGVPDYCDILFQPTTGKYEWDNTKYASSFKHTSEKAYAGFYGVHLNKYNINVKLTTTTHTGFHSYTYPENTTVGNVIIDLKHRDIVLDSYIEMVDSVTIKGYRCSKSWANNQKIFFVAKFNKPIIKSEINLTDNSQFIIKNKTAKGNGIQAAISFDVSDNKPVLALVGLSGVSMDGALENLNAEIKSFDFDIAVNENVKSWNKELSKIEIESFPENNIDTTFYTALYHMMIVPNNFEDVSKNYRGTDDKVHTSQNFTNYTVFSLWDTYRAYHPLMSLIEPKRTNDWINTFLNQYKNGGMLPIWELSGNETFCMIGYHSVPVIVDAYKKGIRNFDTKLALQAMISYSTSKRFGIDKYIANGYLENFAEHESVSKTMEYAFDDWCIAEFASLIGDNKTAAVYYKRSLQFQNLFNPKTNFFQGKLQSSWYTPFEPSEVNNFYTEGNAWHYSLAAPQNIPMLIKLYGGKQNFTKHITNLFTTTSKMLGREQADVTGLIGQYAHGNEPSHHMAYMFNYSNTPQLAAFYVNKICKEFYVNKPDGLIGNEDCGQMSAWYVWSCLGMYPVNPANNILDIGSPQIKSAIINLENGKNIKINVSKKDATQIYPTKVNINNKQIANTQINVDDIINGAEINMNLTAKPTSLNSVATVTNDKSFVVVPYVENVSNKFAGSTKIILKSIQANAIYYSVSQDLNNTKDTFVLYKKPITISEKCNIKFYAQHASYKSNVVSQMFYKTQNDKTIKVLTTVNPMYTAGGDNSLIDGIVGTENWRAGEWQSYYGNNFEAIIDFKKVKPIHIINLSFLQDTRSWIWMPKNVKIFTSNNNIDFELHNNIYNAIDEKDEAIQVSTIQASLKNINTRYIKIIAENYGKIPYWHLGAGNNAHLFISEIDIK